MLPMRKVRAGWWGALILGVGFGLGCGEKDPGTAAAAKTPEGESEPALVVEESPALEIIPWGPEHAGFAQHLPADTSLYLDARGLEAIWELLAELESSEVAEKLEEARGTDAADELAEAAGVDLEQAEALAEKAEEELGLVLPELFGEEVFFSVRGLNWWLQPAVALRQELQPQLVAAMTTALANLEMDGGESMEEQLGKSMQGIVDRLKESLAEVNGQPVLAIQMGGRVTEERTAVMTQLREWMEKSAGEGELAKRHFFTRNGVDWDGLQIEWTSEDV